MSSHTTAEEYQILVLAYLKKCNKVYVLGRLLKLIVICSLASFSS